MNDKLSQAVFMLKQHTSNDSRSTATVVLLEIWEVWTTAGSGE